MNYQRITYQPGRIVTVYLGEDTIEKLDSLTSAPRQRSGLIRQAIERLLCETQETPAA